RAGLLLVHYGLLLLIGGGFFITVTAREYSLTLSEGESSDALAAADGRMGAVLPMTVKLLDFTKLVHPGTDIPRSFSSRVEIAAGGARRQAVISMNRPLRYRDYTFYQSSYAEDGRGGESSTFLVVRNSGRWLPYAASALLFLGLAGHFLAMLAAALKKPRPAKEPPRP
ncbi:MAG TPA: cytochrome c biogenesis protein ResB, partial [Acidobacteriota bacterium]